MKAKPHSTHQPKANLLLLFFIFCAGADGYAQTFQWAKRMGAASTPLYSSDIVVDAAGNSFTTGWFQNTIDFDPGPGTSFLTAANSDGFICKLNTAGNLVWIKNIGGQGRSITLDNAGNVYVSGYFGGTPDFDPGAGVFNMTSSGTAAFAVKLSAAGNFIWAKKFDGTGVGSDYGDDIAVDVSGNVYVGGHFGSPTLDCDPGAGIVNLISAGQTDIFIVKLTAAGNLTWGKRLGGTETDYFNSLAIDATGSVYATGYFTDIADFDPGAGVYNLNATNGLGAYLSKLSSAGNFVWAKQFGGINGTAWGYSVAVDGTGYVYLTGIFYSTADFDPGAAVYNLTPAGGFDVYVLKLSATGIFTWAKRFGGTDMESLPFLALDNLNNVYITGHFRLTVDFNPGAGTFNLTSSGNDLYVNKLTSSGNFSWAFKISPSLGNSISTRSIDVDASGNVYNTGTFLGTIDFNPLAGIFNQTAIGSPDMYVFKMAIPSPLPIELLTFTATQNKNTVEITWQTATETNNHYFTIEKSKDANEFIEVEKIDGAGNSNTVLKYSFTDENPFAGISYYRLKQTDFNGEFSYSKTVAVYVNSNANNQFLIYHNQTTAQLIVAFTNPQTQPCKLAIHDVAGRIVYEQQITSATAIINTTLLPGIYIAVVTDGQQKFTQKFIAK